MTLAFGDMDRMRSRDELGATPRFWRKAAAALTLSTTFQRLDFGTSITNEFPTNPAGQNLVAWDSGNKLIRFNGTTDRAYVFALTTEFKLTGLLVALTLPNHVRMRFVIPDGTSPGVDYYFPNHGAASGNEYVDFHPFMGNASNVHRQLEQVYADSVKRTNGLGIEVRLASSLLTGTATIEEAHIYMAA